MLDPKIARPLVALLGVTLAAAPLPAAAARTVHCASEGHRYQYCRVETDNQVTLERQISGARCVQGSSWGFDQYGIWVDRGCEAEFRAGKESGKNDAVAAGVAIAGLAILAAIASNKGGGQQSADLPAWAVGSFSGYDDYEQTDVRLTVLPGGSVSGYAGRNRFEGTFANSRLEVGRFTFNVRQWSNGFMATDERNGEHRIAFRRDGGGY